MEKSEVLLYVTEDGTVKLEVAMEAETVWLEKAHKEYEKYSEKTKLHLSAVERHYLEAISTLEGIEEKQE